MIARIRLAGALAQTLIIDQEHADCGKLTDDIGVRFDGEGPSPWSTAPWVMSWDDFEAAYKTLKKARATQTGSADR